VCGIRGSFSTAFIQLFYSFSTAFLQLFYSFSTAFLQLFHSFSSAFSQLSQIEYQIYWRGGSRRSLLLDRPPLEE
jgi:hypothetical protein